MHIYKLLDFICYGLTFLQELLECVSTSNSYNINIQSYFLLWLMLDVRLIDAHYLCSIKPF